jgi:hypothetical protein
VPLANDQNVIQACATRFFNAGFLRLISCRANSPPCSLVKLFEPIKAIAAVAHHLAGLADVPSSSRPRSLPRSGSFATRLGRARRAPLGPGGRHLFCSRQAAKAAQCQDRNRQINPRLSWFHVQRKSVHYPPRRQIPEDVGHLER